MSKQKDLYEQRGVSSSKSGVHEAVKIFDKGLFENTFCKFLPDVFTNDPDYCMLMHGDGAGTKVILPYLYWKTTGDPKWFRTIVQDALVMNLDDMAAAGVVEAPNEGKPNTGSPGWIAIRTTSSRRARATTVKLQEKVRTTSPTSAVSPPEGGMVTPYPANVSIKSCVPCMSSFNNASGTPKALRSIVELIMKACVYDPLDNSGIGANGLTSARHDILAPAYRDHKECYDVDNVHTKIPMSVIYNGKYLITDPEAELLMHPTRTYLPLLKRMKEEGLMKHVTGIIHNTGGGHTKVLKFVPSRGTIIIKRFDSHIPEIFRLIQKTRDCSWKEMFRTFNMGVRLEVYAPENIIGELRALGADLGLAPVMDGEVYGSTNTESTVSICHADIGMTPIVYRNGK